MTTIAKPTVNLSAKQIDAIVGRARYERSKVFHGNLRTLSAWVAKLFGGISASQGTPATS